ncbi:MAG: hypothetical protein EHM24_23240 [Acidobacteria bacterium]|nr:MAG: hypothetical protein EHM24_23240 [Acidobacteriota bacterium]
MNQASIARGPARARRIARRCLGILLLGPVALAALTFAQSARLNVEREGDRLRLSAPQLHFLAGQPLGQLHDGRSVTYVFTVTLQVERGQARGAGVTRQVVFSYDLWEERFSVARVDDPNTSASHLTAAAAEAWCIDLLSLPASAAPADKTFVVKLECSLREENAPPADAPATTTLTGLIDLLSRTARETPPRWEALSVPLRLAELKGRAGK